MKDVTIIGAGVVGLCSAYYLNKAGYSVQIIDRKKEVSDLNCSFGNAGMVVPSHFVPLSAPGVITKGLKWMLDSSGPFYIKPRFNSDLWKWIWKFYRHSTEEHVEQSADILHNLNALSKSLYASISKEVSFDFGYNEKGLLMLYKTAECEREELEMAEKANKLGIEALQLTKEQIAGIQGVELDVLGGVLFTGDAHLNPNAFMLGLKTHLKNSGVEFHYDTEVKDLTVEGGRVRAIQTSNGSFDIKQVLFATGAWTPEVVRKMKLNLLLQAGKGYSFDIQNPEANLKVPSIFCEAKVAVTPFNEAIRFAGTMEISGTSLKRNEKRVQAIKNSINRYMPGFTHGASQVSDAWAGLRPCSPDGLPYIGRGALSNTFVASGHAMMGMSLGPVTGKLITEIIDSKEPSLNIQRLSPLRFS